MVKSIPVTQNFFSFDSAIEIRAIVEVLESISKDFFSLKPPNINVMAADETLADLELNNVEKHFNNNREKINLIDFSFSEKDKFFHIISQFKNEFIGPNGNYTIRLNDKKVNKDLSLNLESELNLGPQKIIQMGKALTDDAMIIRPIHKVREFKVRRNYCFVLMPFSELWSDTIWQSIKKITGDEGFEVKRADDLYGHDVLDDIWVSINEASIIIADVTSRNPNVFYEVGIAHTVGKKVILLTQTEADIPFDFNRYRHLIYGEDMNDLTELESSLPHFLSETDGKEDKSIIT